MKLYTYFRASELAMARSFSILMSSNGQTLEGERKALQSQNLRNGLIRRMERLEIRSALLEDRVLQLLSSEFDGE